MDKKIIWEHFNPREQMQEVLDERAAQAESWEEKNQPTPKLLESPFNPQDYWIGHTNFKLTKKHCYLLDTAINGVEGFKVLSPYRIIVIPGKVFNWSDVRLEIEKQFCNRHINYTNNVSLNNKIQTTKSSLTDHKFWALFVFPNGEIHTAKSNILDTKFLAEVKKMNQLKKTTQGIVIESETCKKKS